MVDLVDDRERDFYTKALAALEDGGVEFMLGGAFAVYHYTGWWRNTHDMDVYIAPDSLEAAKQALESAGFLDLGEQAPGDHEWIYHAGRESMIVDAIYRFANLANYVEPEWFDRASAGQFLDVDVRFLPVEELVWVKTFVINRDRCDWPDIMRVIRAQCRRLDWSRLVDLIGEHWLLLEGLISVFDWQYPGSMGCIPDQIRDELAERHRRYRENPTNVEREYLLDPWLHQRADVYAIRCNEQPDDRCI